MSESEQLQTTVARIDERVKADRKATTIYHQHLSGELSEIKLMLKQHFADEETTKLQFAFVVDKIATLEKSKHDDIEVYIKQRDEIKDSIRKVEKDLDHYKNKMKYWEFFQEWKHTPFWTFMAIYIVIARKEIKHLIDSLIDKFAGI